MIFIVSLVLLFILKIRFPSNQPIANIIKARYGAPALQAFRRLESELRKRDKLQCDIDYLQTCLHYRATPKFLRIKLYK